jgi:hypothetical protein
MHRLILPQRSREAEALRDTERLRQLTYRLTIAAGASTSEASLLLCFSEVK